MKIIGCLAFNYNKVTQQCDFINTLEATETLNPIYMTGPQMCGVMTGFEIHYLKYDKPIFVLYIKYKVMIKYIWSWKNRYFMYNNTYGLIIAQILDYKTCHHTTHLRTCNKDGIEGLCCFQSIDKVTLLCGFVVVECQAAYYFH